MKTNRILFLVFFTIAISFFEVKGQCPSGGATFSTQQALDNWVQQYPNCSELNGNLTIAGTVSDLSGLDQLTTVHRITIINNTELTNLSGLDNIHTISGSSNFLAIQGAETLENLEGLGSLVNVDNIQISNSPALSSLQGLNSLDNVNQISLSTCQNITNLSGLETISSTGSLSLNNLDNLSTLDGAENLVVLSSINLSNLPLLSSLEHMPNVENTDFNNLFIYECPGLSNFDGFDSNTVFHGFLYVFDNNNITSLTGLSNCDFSNARANFSDLLVENLSDLEGINSFYDLTFSSCPLLSSIEDLAGIGLSKFSLVNCDLVNNLSGLEHLVSMETLRFSNNDNLTDITALSNLVNTKSISFNGNSLTSLAGLNNLTTAGEVYTTFGKGITIENENLLQNFDELSSLVSVEDLTIRNNAQLENIDALVNVLGFESINISNNSMLQNIDGLSNTVSILRYLILDNNPFLADINGLNNVGTDEIGVEFNFVRIKDNPLISTCDNSLICEYIDQAQTNTDLTLDIMNNAPGCNSVAEVEAACNSCDLILTPSITHTTCNEDNGEIDITVSNTNDPITFTMNGSPQTFPATGLEDGSYEIIGEDPNMCKDTIYVTIDNSTSLIWDVIPSATTCGENNGNINPVIIFANGDVTFTMDGQAVTAPINNLAPGNYNLVATDEDGCTASEVITIDSSQDIDVSFTPIHTTCGQTNGGVTSTETFGNGAISYTLNGGFATMPFLGLEEGTYSLVATDEGGCSYSETVTINASQDLDISYASTPTTCASPNGEIDATIAFSNGLVTYTIDGTTTTMPITGLSVGSYMIVATDADGCSSSESVTVDAIDGLDFTLTSTHTTCAMDNGAATIEVVTGAEPITYTLEGNAVNFPLSGLAAGSYTVVGTDANGCPKTETLTIDGSQDIDVSYTATNTTCAVDNGTIDASVIFSNGATTYMIDGAVTSLPISNLAAGTYMLEATDDDGCSITESVTVDFVENIDFSISVTNTTCGEANGVANVTANSGSLPITYTLGGNPITFPITNLPSSHYLVVGTDALGCVQEVEFEIISSSNIDLDFIPTHTLCNLDNGAIDATVTFANGIVSYTIDGTPTSMPITGLAAGTYAISAMDEDGCAYSESVTIDSSDPLVLDISKTNTTCNLDNGTFSASLVTGVSPVTYMLNGSPASANIVMMAAGTYDLEATDANGCIYTETFIIEDSEVLDFEITSTPTSCNQPNGAMDVVINSGAQPIVFTDQNGVIITFPYMNLAPGDYTIRGVDADDCELYIDISIAPSEILTFSLIGTDAICEGANGEIDAMLNTGVEPVVYSINGSTTNMPITGVAAGTYTIEGIDADGCVYTDDITILGSDPLSFTTNVTHTTCDTDNGAINVSFLTGTEPVSYTLNGAAVTFPVSDLAPNSYTIIGTDAVGCTQETSVLILDSDPLEFTTEVVPATCALANGEVTTTLITGATPVTYSLTGFGSNTTGFFSGLVPGTYDMDGLDDDGCVYSISFTIDVSNTLDAALSAEHTTCAEDNGVVNLTIISGNAPYDITLNGTPVSGTAFGGLPSGNYTVDIMDADGCTWSESISIDDSTLPIMAIDFKSTSCGEDNGEMYITPSMGVAPYQINIGSGFSSDLDYDNLSPGTYNVTVRDNEGCETSQTVILMDSRPIVHTIHVDDADCDNLSGVITMIALDGTAPLLYSIENEFVFRQNTNGTFSNVEAGTYIARFTGADGCVVTESIVVENDQGIELTVDIKHPNCNEENGGITYQLGSSGTAPYVVYMDGLILEDSLYEDYIVSDLSNGDYNLEVVDFYGCSDYTEVTLNDGNSIVERLDITHVDCDGNPGSINVVIGNPGNYTFALDGETNTTGVFSDLMTGSYIFSATDSMGCDYMQVVEIRDESFTSIDIQLLNPICTEVSDMKVRALDGTAPYDYYVNGKRYYQRGVNKLQPGTYKVEVIDANGCSVVETIEVEGESKLTFVTEKCLAPEFGEPGFLVVEGLGGVAPYRYKLDQFYSNSGLFVNLYKTEYTLTVIDGLGCTSSFNVALCGDMNKSTIRNDKNKFQDITIYPNPGHNTLNINHGLGQERITVYNNTGQLTQQITINTEAPITTLNTEDWVKGIYLIKIGSDKVMKWFKI